MQAVFPSDPTLQPYLQAIEEKEALHELEALLSQVESTIRAVIRRRWSHSTTASEQDRQRAEDIFGEVVYQLVARLREIRSAPVPPHTMVPGSPTEGGGSSRSPSISNFRAFAATIAARVCDAYVREKYPNRNRLRRRLEYLLGEQSPVRGLAVWTSAEGRRLAGFAQWRDRNRRPAGGAHYRRLLENPQDVVKSQFAHADPAQVDPSELLAAFFDGLGGPIEFDELVGLMARVWSVTDEPVEALEEDQESPFLSGNGPGVETIVVRMEYLQALWSEIRQLPTRQAAALLLNLRDPGGNGLIALLPITRTASLTEIAGAIGMEPVELARIWNGLPMDDLRLGELLGCTRQQVINLRRSARERLARRMEIFAT